MNTEERINWVNSLKVGDKVLVSSRYREIITTVKKITPTQIVLENGDRYRKTNCVAIGSSIWDSSRIIELTPEILMRVQLQNAQCLLIARLEKVQIKKISLEGINKINKVLDEVLNGGGRE